MLEACTENEMVWQTPWGIGKAESAINYYAKAPPPVGKAVHARGRDGEVFLLCRGRVSTTCTREFRNAFMWDTAFTQDNCSRPISDKVEAHDVYKKEHQARQGSQQREAQRMKPICMDAWKKKHRADTGKAGLGHTLNTKQRALFT